MTRADAPVDVTAVVVSYNSASMLPGLIESLPEAMRGVATWRLVVADNDSHDGSPELVQRLLPDARVVRMGRNAGYAAGINAAVAASEDSRAYLMLNPDVRLRPDCLQEMLGTLDEPGTGLVVPRLESEQGHLHWSLRREPSVGGAYAEALLGGRRAGRLRGLGEMVTDPADYAEPRAADWATGAVMLVSRECLDRVGQWDESFFLYSEETDFALRARDLGLLTRYTPRAVAVHVGGESHVSPRLYSILTRNRVRLFRRRHGRAAATAFWGAVVLNEVLRCRSAVHRRALRDLGRRSSYGPQTADTP